MPRTSESLIDMAPTVKKRSQKEASPNSRKRQKILQKSGGSQKRAGLDPRSLDALPWNEVALPDRLDDAEGFFGLEEVSDVEVVRDPNLCNVEYRVAKTSGKSAIDYPMLIYLATL